VWVLLSVLVRALWRVLSQVALRILPGLLRAVVVALAVAAVLSLPVVVMVLVHFVKGPPEAEQCSTSTMATRPPDHAAADRLSRALDRLAGVTATNVEFDDALWPAHVERVNVRVTFAADVGPEQVVAAVPLAVDGLRGPEFSGLDTYVAFVIDPAVPASEYQVFGLPATEDVLADAAVWLDLHSRHPGTTVQLCRDRDGGVNRTVEMPIVWNEDPALVTAAFAELRSLPVDLFHWSWASVRAVPGNPGGPPSRSTFTVVEQIPDDDSIREMTSAVRRPPPMSPTDELEATVTSYPSMGDSAPRMDVIIEFGLEELRHASVSEVLDPRSRAQHAAAAFAAQAEAAGEFGRLDVRLWDTQILDE
jgi:hypothetical protein